MRKRTLLIVCMMLVTSFAGILFVKTSVAAPTNQSPVFGTPSPGNSSTGSLLILSWNIPINDPEGNHIVWTIQCSNGQTTSSSGFGLLGTGAFNGSAYLGLSGLSYSTTYKVWVNATDPAGSGLYTRRWFTFTTQKSGGNNPPVLGKSLLLVY
ncbi:MAG: hypothetical protein NTX92_09090 [Euryarchaeota archaeon]|nr:hypothetical protein [Euryarchaeota archaeon]